MSPIVAKTRLMERGSNIADLARRLGYSRTAVSLAINHGFNSGVLDAVRKELAL